MAFSVRRKYFRGRPEVRQLSPTPDPRPLQSTPQQNTSVTPTPQPGKSSVSSVSTR